MNCCNIVSFGVNDFHIYCCVLSGYSEVSIADITLGLDARLYSFRGVRNGHCGADLQKVVTGATGGRGKFSYSGEIWGNSSFSHQETVIFPH